MDQFFWFYVSQKQKIKMISQANLSLWKMGKWKQKKQQKQTLKKMEATHFFSLYFKTGGCILLKK